MARRSVREVLLAALEGYQTGGMSFIRRKGEPMLTVHLTPDEALSLVAGPVVEGRDVSYAESEAYGKVWDAYRRPAQNHTLESCSAGVRVSREEWLAFERLYDGEPDAWDDAATHDTALNSLRDKLRDLAGALEKDG